MSPYTVLTERPENIDARYTAPITWDVSAEPFLTVPLRVLLADFLSLLERTPYAPVIKTEIRGFQDPEEDAPQIIVRQWVALTPTEATASLEALGQQVEAWMDMLPPEEKTLFLTQIAFQLRRDDHAGL